MSDKPGLVIHGGSLATVADAARRAEQAGFESVWTTEFYDRSATVSLAAMAQATKSITIGSAIMYAVGRSPLILAIEAQDLDELSGGRLVLGLGTGTKRMQSDWHGADPSSPAPRVEELVPLLRELWAMSEGGVDHQGRFYSLHLERIGHVRDTGRTSIPVYLGGVNPRMLTAVGRVGDGLIGHPLFTRRYVEEVVRPTLAEAAATAERDTPQVAGYVLCAIHDDPEVARREAKAQIAFYALTRTYEVIMRLHAFESQAAEARSAWHADDRDAMVTAISDEMLATIAVAGTADQVRDQLTANFAGLYDRVLLYPPNYGVPPGRLRESIDAIIDTFAVSPGALR